MKKLALGEFAEKLVYVTATLNLTDSTNSEGGSYDEEELFEKADRFIDVCEDNGAFVGTLTTSKDELTSMIVMKNSVCHRSVLDSVKKLDFLSNVKNYKPVDANYSEIWDKEDPLGHLELDT